MADTLLSPNVKRKKSRPAELESALADRLGRIGIGQTRAFYPRMAVAAGLVIAEADGIALAPDEIIIPGACFFAVTDKN